MHEELVRALGPILSDAKTSGVPVPLIVDDDWIEFPEMTSAMFGGMGIRVRIGVPEAEQVAEIADQVQEWIIEDRQAFAPTNWPACPSHPGTHPLKPAAVDGVAMWVCPREGTLVAGIGSLDEA